MKYKHCTSGIFAEKIHEVNGAVVLVKNSSIDPGGIHAWTVSSEDFEKYWSPIVQLSDLKPGDKFKFFNFFNPDINRTDPITGEKRLDNSCTNRVYTLINHNVMTKVSRGNHPIKYVYIRDDYTLCSSHIDFDVVKC